MNFSITHEEIKTSLNQQKNKNNTSVMGYIYVALKFCAICEFIIINIISFATFVQDVFSNNHRLTLYSKLFPLILLPIFTGRTKNFLSILYVIYSVIYKWQLSQWVFQNILSWRIFQGLKIRIDYSACYLVFNTQ